MFAAEIVCPINPEDNIIVLKTYREDYLLRAKQNKDIDENEFNVGRDLQAAYENLEARTLRAIDTTKDRVDGGTFYNAAGDDTRDKAIEFIGWAKGVIGEGNEPIMRDILGHGLSPTQVALKRGYEGTKMISHFAWLFRRCLEQLVTASSAVGASPNHNR